METDADVDIRLIQRGLRVVVPRASEKDAANVLQRAQEYMNGIKLMNEAIVDNITDKNKKITNYKLLRTLAEYWFSQNKNASG